MQPTVLVRQTNANEHEVREVQRKIQFQTASGELLEHHGEKLVPYMAQDSVMGITYQVTDVEGPVAAVSSMNDGGMTEGEGEGGGEGEDDGEGEGEGEETETETETEMEMEMAKEMAKEKEEKEEKEMEEKEN